MKLSIPRLRISALVALALGSTAVFVGRPRGGGAGGDVGNKPAQVQPRSKVFAGEDHP